jgi:histidyl-tRNA synthetase
MFSGGKTIPCVGVSIGVERCFSMISRKFIKTDIKASATQVYICSIDGLLKERMEICKSLWDADIKAEFMMKQNPKLPKQLSHCEKSQIPLAVIIGPNELELGVVNVKNLVAKSEEKVKRTELVGYIQNILAKQDLDADWSL